jgi:hypothetical protein
MQSTGSGPAQPSYRNYCRKFGQLWKFISLPFAFQSNLETLVPFLMRFLLR